jgi:hypothetical protein
MGINVCISNHNLHFIAFGQQDREKIIIVHVRSTSGGDNNQLAIKH